MSHLVSLIGIAGAFVMIKYREQVANMCGEAEWMRKVGGVYNVVIMVAIAIFFFSLARLTGTTELLLDPLLSLIPGLKGPPDPTF